MSLLQIRIGMGVLALLALLTLRGKRWAYFAFLVLGLAYFPAQAHFSIHAPRCEQLISKAILLVSVQNYAYVALFAGFYWMSWVQFRRTDARVLWAMLATVLAGVLLEVAEGMSGRVGARAPVLCRVRDLAPVVAGALGAALVLAIWSRLTRKPGYVRLVRKGQPVAPSRTIAPTRPAAPRAATLAPPPIPYLPPLDPAVRVVPPEPDFSPTPSEPTEEVASVAPTERRSTQQVIIQRLRAIWERALAVLQRLWEVIRGRRRAIIIGSLVLILVGAAGVVVVLLMPAPAPTTVVEQPQAPPPPPPRPLQSEAVGYYEPDYQFAIAGRRFTRLTLRPEAFLTFARYAGKDEAGCAEARIGQQAVFLRCEVDRVGVVTIDGRFTSRFATSRLDAGVLSAVITVRNPRGEVVYRARDSFRWHEPD